MKKEYLNILGLETSCDETAAAVVARGREVLSSIVSSQVELHAPFGGVVPELASRRHLDNALPVLEAALTEARLGLDQIDAVAVTRGPGLMGALLVGLSLAKALALSLNKPLVAVDHLSAHVAAVFLKPLKPRLPAISLVVSGGHSSLFRVEALPDGLRPLGQTLDDAAGEAFDKVGKLLGLAYPAGAMIEKLAASGRARLPFPRPLLDGSLNFSFSGLKTAVLNYAKTHSIQAPGQPLKPGQIPLADVCASFQEAVVEVLTSKTVLCARRQKIEQVILVGGVAANQRLRFALEAALAAEGVELLAPGLEFCTDNAAMVAAAGHYALLNGHRAGMADDAISRTALSAKVHSS